MNQWEDMINTNYALVHSWIHAAQIYKIVKESSMHNKYLTTKINTKTMPGKIWRFCNMHIFTDFKFLNPSQGMAYRMQCKI